MARQYRHNFDASTLTVPFPGAIIDKTLRQDDYSADKQGVSVFLENTVTGLIGMGLDVYMPDIDSHVFSTFTNSYASPIVTCTGNFTDVGTNPNDICIGYITVLANAKTTTYPCTVTAGFGTLTGVATFSMVTGTTMVIKMNVADQAGNWAGETKLGASYVV
jgi:hypothetical protein